MANNDNLKRLTPSQAQEYGRRGGKASGASRRKKADLRKTLNVLLAARIDNEEWTPVLEALGLDSTLEAAVSAAIIKEALQGNVKAYLAIKDVLGQTSKSDTDIEEQKLRMDAAKSKMGVNDDDDPDDGFLDALKDSVVEDWKCTEEHLSQNEDDEETSI